MITGGSGGIGFEAAAGLAGRGARVILVGRSPAKTNAAAERIMAMHGVGSANVHTEVADLLLQKDVHALADKLLADHSSIHCLINNAGAIFVDRAETAEGLERTFALNHLAPFTLSLRLLGRIAASAATGAPSRIINVSSRAHIRGAFRGNDLQRVRNYSAWRAYGNSKLYNILFTRALSWRLNPEIVTVNALHPGVVSTRFAIDNGWWGRLMRRIMDVVSITPVQGADTMTWLASDPAVVGISGGYFAFRKQARISRDAASTDNAELLWKESERLAHLNADSFIPG